MKFEKDILVTQKVKKDIIRTQIEFIIKYCTKF